MTDMVPRPLRITADRTVVRRRRFPPLIVIAALLGTGGTSFVDSEPDTLRPVATPAPEAAREHADAEGIICPNDAALVALGAPWAAAGAFCIDRYEAPNLAGAYPFAYMNASEAEAWCAYTGRRLCTEEEWVVACRGLAWHRFPYGPTAARATCNDAKRWRGSRSLGGADVDWARLQSWPALFAFDAAAELYQADPSGFNWRCRGDAGIYDLVGNVAEWTRAPSRRYGYAVQGGYWSGIYGGGDPACDTPNPAHDAGFRSYEFGARCCADATFTP